MIDSNDEGYREGASRGLDNYLVTLARVVQKLGLPLREDGWPAVQTRGSGVAFHLGRFVYHAARLQESR